MLSCNLDKVLPNRKHLVGVLSSYQPLVLPMPKESVQTVAFIGKNVQIWWREHIPYSYPSPPPLWPGAYLDLNLGIICMGECLDKRNGLRETGQRGAMYVCVWVGVQVCEPGHELAANTYIRPNASIAPNAYLCIAECKMRVSVQIATGCNA